MKILSITKTITITGAVPQGKRPRGETYVIVVNGRICGRAPVHESHVNRGVGYGKRTFSIACANEITEYEASILRGGDVDLEFRSLDGVTAVHFMAVSTTSELRLELDELERRNDLEGTRCRLVSQDGSISMHVFIPATTRERLNAIVTEISEDAEVQLRAGARSDFVVEPAH